MEYYYISAANKAEGPVSTEQLQDLLAAGTISSDTKIAPVGAQEWQPLHTVISSASAPGTPLAPPPLQPSPFAQPFPPRPAQPRAAAGTPPQFASPQQQPIYYQSAPTPDPLAIVALVLAIVSYPLFCLGIFFSVPAVVCAHISRNRIESNPELEGNGLAVASLWVGYINIGLFLLFFISGCLQGLAQAASGPPM